VAFDPNTTETILGVEVVNPCECIVLAKQKDEGIYFHLSEDKQLFSTQATRSGIYRHVPILPIKPQPISLDEYLRSQHRKIPDRKRIELATKLASSILQYNETHWFKKGYTKDVIYFFKDTSSIAGIDIDHPLISEPLPLLIASPPTNAPTNAPTNTPDPADGTNSKEPTQWPEPHDTLLELAILLMELYHKTRFEDWMAKKHQDVDQGILSDIDWKRTYAFKWFREFPRGADIHEVVAVCLWPQPLEHIEPCWEDDRFRCAFYSHVIAPLLI